MIWLLHVLLKLEKGLHRKWVLKMSVFAYYVIDFQSLKEFFFFFFWLHNFCVSFVIGTVGDFCCHCDTGH